MEKLSLHGNSKNTILTYEEPCDYKDNYMERYYPVKDLEEKIEIFTINILE